MTNVDIHIVNSCRVCRNDAQDDEQLASLLQDDQMSLSEHGLLYEELMNLQINTEDMHRYPLYLCNNCELLMRLFKKLKDKSKRTLDTLQAQFSAEHNATMLVEYLESEQEQTEEEEETEFSQSEFDADNTNEHFFTDIQYLEEEEYVETENQPPKPQHTKLQRGKGFDCYYCQEHFKKRKDYQRHRTVVHENKYPCTECTNNFQTADALRVHMKTHRNDAAFKCNICERTFNQKVHWNRHMNRHNNVREFSCEKCGKAFLCKSDLVIHIRTHTGDKRYVCHICGKGFLLHQHLKMHAYTHTGEKGFKCDICQHRFVSPSTLRSHQRTMHQPLRFQCGKCAKLFRRKHHLNSHLRVHDKEIAGITCQEDLKQQAFPETTADNIMDEAALQMLQQLEQPIIEESETEKQEFAVLLQLDEVPNLLQTNFNA